LLFLSVLCFHGMLFGQEPSLVEAEVIAVKKGPRPVFDLQIDKVRNGKMDSLFVRAEVIEGREDLALGMIKHMAQKWLLTIVPKLSGDGYLIRSVYGLSSLEPGKIVDPISTPLIGKFDNRTSGSPYARSLSPGEEEQEIVELTNIERWNNGMLPPYKQVTELHNAADGHSIRMAQLDFFAHCDLYSNKSAGQRMTDAGYSWNAAAENIAGNYVDVEAAMIDWMASSGHRTNILSTTYREIGAGYDPDSDNDDTFKDNGSCDPGENIMDIDRYYTQNFGRRGSVYPVVIDREIAQTSNRNINLYVYGPGSATSMRFSNDGTSWSAWINYLPDHTWILTTGDGMKTVYSEVSTGSNGSGTVYGASDMIELINSCDPMTFSNTTLSGTQTHTACEIIADPNVTISGDIIFEAPKVTLDNNVDVPLGATLEIRNQ